ncbi:hypothetical protein AGMMS49957_06010 [Synergistales bacterium]|nr:hypothetical protein AGMMS49957_06010 [Synergistales bacterium]
MLLSTGTCEPSENWAFVPFRSISKNDVENALSFFDMANVPFIWPVLLGADKHYGRALTDAGLFMRGELLAMRADNISLDAPLDIAFRSVKTESDAVLWAHTTWRAFSDSSDSLPDAPDSFVALSRGLLTNDSFEMNIAYREGEPIGAFMVVSGKSELGVYYFATHPKKRRCGVGLAMMNECSRIAAGRVIVLQSTPSGAPFYTSVGFKTLFAIPLHSREESVF